MATVLLRVSMNVECPWMVSSGRKKDKRGAKTETSIETNGHAGKSKVGEFLKNITTLLVMKVSSS